MSFPYVSARVGGISIKFAGPFFVVVFFKMADEFKFCGVGAKTSFNSLLSKIRKCNLLVSASLFTCCNSKCLLLIVLATRT